MRQYMYLNLDTYLIRFVEIGWQNHSKSWKIKIHFIHEETDRRLQQYAPNMDGTSVGAGSLCRTTNEDSTSMYGFRAKIFTWTLNGWAWMDDFVGKIWTSTSKPICGFGIQIIWFKTRNQCVDATWKSRCAVTTLGSHFFYQIHFQIKLFNHVWSWFDHFSWFCSPCLPSRQGYCCV